MLYVSESRDVYRNLALEEALLEGYRGKQPLLLLYRNQPSVVVGAHQNTHREANGALMARRGLRLARRVSGGGSVYHDEGNVCFGYLYPQTGPLVPELGHCLRPVVEGLRRLGIDAAATGRNDILLGSEKITGTAARARKGRLLFHGTLLYDAALDTLQGVLQSEPGLIHAAGTPSVKSPVTNIRRHRDMGPTEDFVRALAQVLHPGPERLALEDGILAEAARLAKEKYPSWDWVYGRNPACTLRLFLSGGGGPPRAVELRCRHDVIEDVSDDALRPVLCGLPLQQNALRQALSPLGLQVLEGEKEDTRESGVT